MSSNRMFQPYCVLQSIALPQHQAPSVDDADKENNPFNVHVTKGGVLFDTKYVWNANGSLLNLYNSKSGAKVAIWNFGSVINSTSTIISCVTELPRGFGKLPFLIIGLQTDQGGQICIFNIMGSRVLHCIEINERVSNISVIDVHKEASFLQRFDGVIAVGTSGGNIYLVNIDRLRCEEVLSSEDVRDEINPCQLEIVELDEDISDISCQDSKHLSVLLNAELGEYDCFVLRGPKEDVRLYVNKQEVEVSALHYCPQLGSLLVGFNFGAWQLWDLMDMKLVYTSPICENNIPVSHFGVQEPCDDPRTFCYVWVVYSNIEPNQPGYSLAVLYSLNYENKICVDGHGVLYKNLTSCSVRFQMDVTSCQNEIGKSIRVQCINLQIITKAISRNSFADNQDETLTVCSIVWNVWSSNFPNKCRTYLSLFDLNQWYKEQMPVHSNSKDCETYLSHTCLSNILKDHDKQMLLDVRINSDTLNQFVGCQRLEEHYYPAALAFQMVALGETAISTIDNKGKQRALMTGLETLGPSVLMKPTEPFLLSINLGLTPLFVDVPNKESTPIEHQRELLLSLALEQRLLGWLCKCITIWSSGVYESSGCTLNFLLLWGWQRAQVLKENADKLSVILFDYSGLRLDSNTHNLLGHCLRQLKCISTLFKFIERKFLGFVLNPEVVKEQCDSLEMVSTHLEVVDWLLNIGLLPECSENNYPRTDDFGRINAPYPLQRLNKYYKDRRSELNLIAKGKNSSRDSMLFIDNLIEIEFKDSLTRQWNSVSECSDYPPPSLQALTRTYLVDNVSVLYKHCVVAYFLFDISLALDQNQYRTTITHMLKFPSVFRLSPGLTKIIQSFWQLDHGEFQSAVEQLLDPMVSSNDLKPWHHKVVLRMLVGHEQYGLALFYLQVRKPPITEESDLCTILTLYVASNMIDEAFHFQRQNVTARLLHHFYKECDKRCNVKAILFLPLTKEEEDAFIKYLNDVNHPQANELKIYFYTQRSRYVDAFQVYNKSGRIMSESRGLEGQHVLSNTDNIMKKLNNVANPLSKSIMDQVNKKDMKISKVTNPQPFSVFVHNSEEQVKYKSSIIQAALVQARETWKQFSPNKTLTNNDITGDIPFLSTPRARVPSARVLKPIIYSQPLYTQDDDGPSPPKRFKPTSRLSVSSVTTNSDLEVTCRKLSLRLDTPVVRRKPKNTFERQIPQLIRIDTPQSILKSQIHKLVDSSENDDKKPYHNLVKDNDATFNISTSFTSRSSLGLTPRRSLLGTSKHAVRFSFSKPPSESSVTSNNSDADFEIIEESALVHSSLHELDKKEDDTLREEENTSFETKKSDSTEVDLISHVPRTPRSRRSYRDLSSICVRSSPRLQNLKKAEINAQDISTQEVQLNKSLTLDSLNNVRSRRSYRTTHQNSIWLPKDVESQQLNKVIEQQILTEVDGVFEEQKKDVESHETGSIEDKVIEDDILQEAVESHKTESIEDKVIEVQILPEVKFILEEQTCSEKVVILENIASQETESIEDKVIEEHILPQEDVVLEEQILPEEDVVLEVQILPEEEVLTSPQIQKHQDEEPDYTQESSKKNVEGEKLSSEASKSGSVEREKVVSPEIQKVDVNIYEDDDFEVVDPKLSVSDVSTDLTLNAAICIEDVDILEIDTSSNYLGDGGEVFGDKLDVLIDPNENVSPTELVLDEEENIKVVSAPTSTVQSENSLHSSASSDVQIIDSKSSSEEDNLDKSTSSEDENVYLTDTESIANSSGSEESISSTSNSLYEEYNINSKDIVANSDKVDTKGQNEMDEEISNSSSTSVVVEGVQENIEVYSTIELDTIYEDGEENFKTEESKDNAGTLELEKTNIEQTTSDCNEKKDDLLIESNEDKFTDNKSNIHSDTINESLIIPDLKVDDLLKTTNAAFMTSTPSQKENENNSYIFSDSDNTGHSLYCPDTDFLNTPSDRRRMNDDSNMSNYLNDSLQNTPIQSLTYSILDDSFASNCGTPVRRSKRISSLHTRNSTDLRKVTLRKRSLSTSNANASVDLSKLKESRSKVVNNKKRSGSESNVLTRSKRATSVDIKLITNDKKTIEDDKPNNKSTRTAKSTTALDQVIAYSSSRRLTRRQAELLKKNLGVDSADVKELENSSGDSSHSLSRGPDIPKIDALTLLNKNSFEGIPDPDEDMVNKSAESSLEDIQQLRSRSSMSNTNSFETSPPSSEKRVTRSKRKLLDGDDKNATINDSSQNQQTKIVPRKIRKTRLTSKDTDVSDTSIISRAHSTIEAKKPGKITRRTKSLVEDNEKPILRRSERNAQKSHLPKIVEESEERSKNKQKRK
ncbi:hypothetical protein FQR65_LT01232 [Abscondita terminalis]|nr:hypothetical protein FQR65_LT01232 [Abscondita terminalis]